MRVKRVGSAVAGGVLLGLATVTTGAGGAGGMAASRSLAPMEAASPPHLSRSGQGLAENAAQSSFNWAGYAVTGSTFSNVAGNWTQPTASCAQAATQAAFWVGLDGFLGSDPTVEQIGTDADCTKGRGKRSGGPSYYAWYEMYPQALMVLPTSRYPVAPGDQIRAGVSVSGTAYTLTITDGSKWIFATRQSARAQNSSAEWIAEAPSTCGKSRCKSVSLTNFGSMAFTSASANGKVISAPGYTDYQITMVTKKSRIVRAAASSLSFGGSVFGVSWLHN